VERRGDPEFGADPRNGARPVGGFAARPRVNRSPPRRVDAGSIA